MTSGDHRHTCICICLHTCTYACKTLIHMVVSACNPRTWETGTEDHLQFEANLIYISSTLGDSVSNFSGWLTPLISTLKKPRLEDA